MSIRLLAFDIDGTISMPGSDVPSAVMEALKSCVKAGIATVPATGKKFSSIKSLCSKLGISGPVISCNGAIIINPRTERIIRAHLMPGYLYGRLISRLEQDRRFALAVFTKTDIVCPSYNYASRALHEIGEPTTRIEESLLSLLSDSVAKVLAATPHVSVLRNAYREYAPVFGPSCSVTITSDKFIEFMPHGVSKGQALLDIATEMGVPLEDTACIGDSNNDLSMFGVAGLGIAVANATPEVLSVAKEVVPSAAEGGVAIAIKRFILGANDGKWQA